MEVGLAGAPGRGLSYWPNCKKSIRRPDLGKDDMSWIQLESPVIIIIAVWLPPWVQQNSSGDHWPIRPPQGLCLSEEVPETTVGLL